MKHNLYQVNYGCSETDKSCIVMAKDIKTVTDYVEVTVRDLRDTIELDKDDYWFEVSVLMPKNRKERAQFTQQGYIRL